MIFIQALLECSTGKQCAELNIVPRGNMEKDSSKENVVLNWPEQLNPWFVTGFSDGEAAFTFSRSGNSFALYFSICQREDNKSIIEKIQNYFGGIGKVYIRKEQLPTKHALWSGR